jgi:Holliday junction resolvase RusA-like endonuclease
MRVSFFVPGVPVAQPRARSGARGRFYTPDNGVKTWKAAIRAAARTALGKKKLQVAILCELQFLMPRPKRLIWKNKPMYMRPCCVKPDIDNLQKAVFDALNGTAWKDDAAIWCVRASKYIAGGDWRNGKLVSEVGVFVFLSSEEDNE